MKRLILTSAFFLLMISAYTQDSVTKKSGTQNPVKIKVPEFSDAEVKKFYTSYANHLTKCIEAIREKNEAKVMALFKNPGEQLVTDEKKLAPKLIKNPVEKEKYMQFAAQVYPYIKEVEQSVYYQKLYGEKGKE